MKYIVITMFSFITFATVSCAGRQSAKSDEVTADENKPVNNDWAHNGLKGRVKTQTITLTAERNNEQVKLNTIITHYNVQGNITKIENFKMEDGKAVPSYTFTYTRTAGGEVNMQAKSADGEIFINAQGKAPGNKSYSLRTTGDSEVKMEVTTHLKDNYLAEKEDTKQLDNDGQVQAHIEKSYIYDKENNKINTVTTIYDKDGNKTGSYETPTTIISKDHNNNPTTISYSMNDNGTTINMIETSNYEYYE